MARTFIPALRRRLGLTEHELPDDATDADIRSALQADPIEARQGDGGFVERFRPGVVRQGPLTADEREGILLAAVEAGKFSAERAKYWRQQLLNDPANAQLIAMLHPVPGARPSSQTVAVEATEEAYPASWLMPDEQPVVQMVNPPVEAQSTVSQITASMPANDTYVGPAVAPPPPGPITFEDPGLAMAFGAAGWGRDREIEHERGEAARQMPGYRS